MRRREIIGTDVAITDYAEVLGAFDAAIEQRRKIFVCCAPASSLVFARRNPELRRAYENAEIVTPDGKGVVLAARLLGEQIEDRVYGPDLMQMQLERAAARGQSVWLYGGFDEAALAMLESTLRERHPDLKIAGSWSPPHRELTGAKTDDLVEMINADAPDIVWVGLGSPKQEIWMNELRGRLDAPVLCGVGAAFDFAIGRVDQAPRWMQKAGLEWLFRLLKDPKRLFGRYLTTLPVFVLLVLGQRLGRSRKSA